MKALSNTNDDISLLTFTALWHPLIPSLSDKPMESVFINEIVSADFTFQNISNKNGNNSNSNGNNSNNSSQDIMTNTTQQSESLVLNNAIEMEMNTETNTCRNNLISLLVLIMQFNQFCETSTHTIDSHQSTAVMSTTFSDSADCTHDSGVPLMTETTDALLSPRSNHHLSLTVLTTHHFTRQYTFLFCLLLRSIRISIESFVTDDTFFDNIFPPESQEQLLQQHTSTSYFSHNHHNNNNNSMTRLTMNNSKHWRWMFGADFKTTLFGL